MSPSHDNSFELDTDDEKDVCCVRIQSVAHSLTHSLIWNIVLACELVSEKQNKFRLQVSTCEVLIDHCHALQTVEPLPFQFD